MLTDRRTDHGRMTDAGVTGILIAHLGAFGSGELKIIMGLFARLPQGICDIGTSLYKPQYI